MCGRNLVEIKLGAGRGDVSIEFPVWEKFARLPVERQAVSGQCNTNFGCTAGFHNIKYHIIAERIIK